MAVIFNAKGTTSPYFLLGKGGTTLFQGSSDPTGSYSASAGDVWFDTNANTLKLLKKLNIEIGFRQKMLSKNTSYISKYKIPRQDHSDIIKKM